MRLQNSQKLKAKQLTERVESADFIFNIYTIHKFVPVSIALSVCVYVRLTSVTDKSKRQHLVFFLAFFDQKPKAGWGAVRTCIELTLKRFSYWIVLLMLLFVGCCLLFFFLYISIL